MEDQIVVPGITIDPEDAPEIDDAVWIKETETGCILAISIADVARAVPKGSPADLRAKELAFSHYHNSKSKLMLPDKLACTTNLVKKKERSAVIVNISLSWGKSPVVGKNELRAGMAKTKARLSYKEADRMIADKSSSRLVCCKLRQLSGVAAALAEQRRKRGATMLCDLSRGIATTEEGYPYIAKHPSDLIVQELMILANVTLTKFLVSRGAHLLFRNHNPDGTGVNRTELAELLARFDPGDPAPREMIARALDHAFYSPQCSGHFGLGLPAYGHFTSPLRRYADLVGQRILHAVLNETRYPYTLRELEEIAEIINQKGKEHRLKKGITSFSL